MSNRSTNLSLGPTPTFILFIKSLAYLFVVECVLLGPVYAFTLCCLLLKYIVENVSSLLGFFYNRAPGQTTALPRRTVLINGCNQTISLHIARALYSAGYRVIACDFQKNWLNPTRFSVAVAEYYTVPRPENGVQEYVRALCDIAQIEKVDVFLPISTATGIVYDALAKSQLEREDCQCFVSSPEQVRKLGNKLSFFQHASKCGLEVPGHFKVTCIAEIVQLYENGIFSHNDSFVLTSLRCNSKYLQDSVVMPSTLDEFIMNIGEHDSYECALLIQELIPGLQVTTSTTIIDANVVAHSACYCEDSYLYEPELTKKTLTWIELFVKSYPTPLHGNFIFNFIVGKNGTLYPESCVAGVGVAAMTFYPEKELGECMLFDVPTKASVHPSMARPIFWLYEEFWKAGTTLPSILSIFTWLRKMILGREAVFRFTDPMPFLALNHLHLPFLVFVNLFQKHFWTAINFRAGKLQI